MCRSAVFVSELVLCIVVYATKLYHCLLWGFCFLWIFVVISKLVTKPQLENKLKLKRALQGASVNDDKP